VAKSASFLIKQAKRNFEEKLARQIKEDRKSFFAYARSKSRSNVKVGVLEDSHGHLLNNPDEKAEILNNFFVCVYQRGC